MPAMDTTRVVVEVVAGLLPGRDPDPEFTKRYVITSKEWQEAGERDRQGELLAEVNGKAQGYAGWLMMMPDQLNWVRTDWIWM